MTIPEGIYDLLLTDALRNRLPIQGAVLHELNADAAVPYLVDELSRQLSRVLEDLPESADAVHQLGLVNALIAELRKRVAPSAGDPVVSPPQLLKAISPETPTPAYPEVGLAQPWLFTSGKGSPSLLREIRSELASADQICVLVSFIQMSGVRKLRDVLQKLTALDGGGKPRRRIRIITTTYTGATEQRALDELASLPGCEVRVSLDGRRTRLHAKAWIFHRESGFGSAYVGSANLSHSALTGGVEWTVKMTQRGQPPLYDRAVAHFESLWEDGEFEKYDPRNDAHRRALESALRKEGGAPDDVVVRGFFDLSPKSYQQEMLEVLALERHHGRFRNLLVAATGTGKTVVAAFDYRRTAETAGGRPRLLFVAHREEILRQALRVFREVLRDPNFGELLTGGARTERFDHVFATIDSVTSREVVSRLGADYWHTVVIDECHRLAADRFHAFANAIRPRVLLGLTATPERSDGQQILGYFDCRPDGSPAVELRLWHALDMQLLAPFEYYACDEPTDFSDVPWDRPGERDAMLDRLLSANDVRAHLVIREWERLASDPARSRALVFCVSVAHAQFMTEKLNRAGLPALCVVGATDTELRRKAPQLLAENKVCALVTVDLYNEGIDLPDVDTLLLLRPTNSPVLFQQQIGRGLRLAPKKDSCLVLDFVGQHRADFRFDRLLGSLTGLSRRELRESVEHGFGSLPPGCHIQLQPKVREQVLRGLRALTQQTWPRLRNELASFAALRGRNAVGLADFVHGQGVDLAEIFRGGPISGWSRLKRDAGLIAGEPGPEELYFSRRFSALLEADDPVRLDLLEQVSQCALNLEASPLVRASVQMLAYQIDAQHEQLGSAEAFVSRLNANPAACAELGELAALLQARSALPMQAVPGLEDTPLCLYAAYSAREILTAVRWLTAERRVPFQAGVLALVDRKTELLFVTLDKTEGYHHGIAYRDYAISTERFHWQTQNAAGPDTRAGRRYIESGTNGWRFQLFVRARRTDAYRPCGLVQMERWEGDRPMSIVWRLERPLPTKLFREFSVLRD